MVREYVVKKKKKEGELFLMEDAHDTQEKKKVRVKKKIDWGMIEWLFFLF